MSGIFPGKPNEAKQIRNLRRFQVSFLTNRPMIEISADRIRFEHGLTAFWEVLPDNPDYDHLVFAVASSLIESIEEIE